MGGVCRLWCEGVGGSKEMPFCPVGCLLCWDPWLCLCSSHSVPLRKKDQCSQKLKITAGNEWGLARRQYGNAGVWSRRCNFTAAPPATGRGRRG